MQDIENDMNALFNAHTHQGRNLSPHVALIRVMLGGNSVYIPNAFLEMK